MKKLITCLLLWCSCIMTTIAKALPVDSLPVRGFCISAPLPHELAPFLRFIDEELAPRHINTLVLRVDFNYQYTSHPELRDSAALSAAQVKQLVAACRKHQIRIIPQINLLGHQSWAVTTMGLLRVYPEFDETPWVKMPEKYVWPNADGLYCKSYCPLHPGVHKIVFELVDEICAAFEATAFHAGMDEVFYIGDDKCPRCSGLDKAELYAGEVQKIRNHLALKGRQLWIWGDRLLDGKTTGLGMWEASMNNTHRAVDLIPKDVMICDWHYERPDKTPVYFAMKGLPVITCPWRKPANAKAQLNDMFNYRETATPEMKSRYQGMMQTVWSGVGHFLDEFYGKGKVPQQDTVNTSANCFRTIFTR
ncbi:family 20 glycosylhydrolase [Chitinophaga nivalis]|uniref:beta-N-acetylhexosaminidase n=1 Tax=Chitinophaga nivalis TaxID=2991709 RepID=A0ABT3IIP7_9BACT|nr:family 20 glycosylhydrolase [Chitinophaga nivalis]MCW3466471.1 family 20 glycosylhydrolase [Chitinophaga nivalis]MCW3483838.1 family 20 glycosylhydrolase [Chitinophaga nivalis]